jgi:hypothetical protein
MLNKNTYSTYFVLYLFHLNFRFFDKIIIYFGTNLILFVIGVPNLLIVFRKSSKLFDSSVKWFCLIHYTTGYLTQIIKG